jgi:hypothetical protein
MQPTPMKLAPSSIIENTKETFESALALMQTTTGRRRRPIARVPGAQPVEKRALTDAARALARLWNLSPNLVR